jgi:hypothetical protein
LASLEKSVELLEDPKCLGATTARYVMETTRLANQSYLDGALSVLPVYIQTSFRAEFGGVSSKLMDYDHDLEFACKIETTLSGQRAPFENAKGNLHLAYGSSFDGKLLPFAYPSRRAMTNPGSIRLRFCCTVAEQHGYILAGPNAPRPKQRLWQRKRCGAGCSRCHRPGAESL